MMFAMNRILGLTPFNFSVRIARATVIGAFNLALWYYLPTIIFSQLDQFIPSSTNSILPIDPYTFSQGNVTDAILLFGITITVLKVFSNISKGHALSHLFSASAALLAAYYIITLLNGGVISLAIDDPSKFLPSNMGSGDIGFSLNAINIVFEFKVLFFFMVIPSFLSVVKHVWQAIHESATVEINMDEIIE
ncbi:hypothetical protein ACFL96_18445 [Thermoproteota archaeon]